MVVAFSHSVMSDSLGPHGPTTPDFPVLHCVRSLLRLMSIELVMPSNHLILWSPPSPLALNLSQQQGLFQKLE